MRLQRRLFCPIRCFLHISFFFKSSNLLLTMYMYSVQCTCTVYMYMLGRSSNFTLKSLYNQRASGRTSLFLCGLPCIFLLFLCSCSFFMNQSTQLPPSFQNINLEQIHLKFKCFPTLNFLPPSPLFVPIKMFLFLQLNYF